MKFIHLTALGALACAGTASAELVQTERHRGTYHMGALAGRNLGDLYAVYIGSKGRIPVRLTVDWDNRIDVLWERKLRRSRHNRVVGQTARSIVARYQTASIHRMTVPDYQALLARESNALWTALDWKKVCRAYLYNSQTKKVNVRKCIALKRASGNFGGRSLLAYSMTERLPSADGRLNVAYDGFVLRNGGREYLESIPAVYDPYLSFGPYQFTQFAVYEKGGERRGASRMNVALPAHLQIPGSVARLRGSDHVRAAWLFGVHNLAIAIKKMPPREFKVFERVADTRALDITEFVATAHNKPAVAIRGIRRWLANSARRPFFISLPRVSQIYAKKTRMNFRALSPTK